MCTLGAPSFGSMSMIWTNFEDDNYALLHTSKPICFLVSEEDIFVKGFTFSFLFSSVNLLVLRQCLTQCEGNLYCPHFGHLCSIMYNYTQRWISKYYLTSFIFSAFRHYWNLLNEIYLYVNKRKSFNMHFVFKYIRALRWSPFN